MGRGLAGLLGRWTAVLLLFAAAPAGAQDDAQDDARQRALLERAAAAMGGLERLQALETVVLTGFGQRVYMQGGGFITGERNAPPKWQSITDAQRTFLLPEERAIYQERWSQEFPFAGLFGLAMARNTTVQTGAALLDHPLPALLEALDPETRLGPLAMEDGLLVVPFTPQGAASPAWIGLDPTSYLPAFSRWVTGSNNLGDVTYTAHFTGYTPFAGVQLPIGLMNTMDWREQVSLMLQVDSYRLDAPAGQLPQAPVAGSGGVPVPQAQVTKVAEGVWDVRVAGDGGAVVEFSDHLVMFEAYGGEAQTLQRIDAANALVPGKSVRSVIVSHHHFDHTGGLRAAVSRGLEVISHRGNEGIIREMATRPAVYFPDALARDPHPLVFRPVDDTLVLEDGTRRLEIYRVVEHSHMPDAVFAYLPRERIMMEGDLGDESWNLHWWGSALAANIRHRRIDPATNVPVHGSGPLSIAQTLANIERQVAAAIEFCRTTEQGGRFVFGCPVQYDAQGALPLLPR